MSRNHATMPQPTAGRLPAFVGAVAVPLVVAIAAGQPETDNHPRLSAQGPTTESPGEEDRGSSRGQESHGDGDAPVVELKRIRGVVVDVDGKPVADAQVWLPGSKERNETTAHARADEEGRFTLEVSGDRESLPGVWAFARNYRLATASGAWALSAEKGGPPLRIVLGRQTDATFLVLTPDGRPLPDASVEPFQLDMSRVQDRGRPPQPTILPLEVRQLVGGTTGADGRARLSAVPRDGLRSVYVTSEAYGTWWQLLDSSEPVPAETKIRLPPAGRIEGRLIADDPKVARGVAVLLTTREVGSASSSAGKAEVTSDDQGRFVVPAIAMGALRIQVQVDEGLPYQPELPKELTVRAADVTRVEIRMARAVRIESIVRAKETEEPLADTRVWIQIGANGQGQFVTSDQQGKFSAYVLPGTIKLNPMFRLPDGGLRGHSWLAKTFTVPAGVECFELPPLEVDSEKANRPELPARAKDLLRGSLAAFLMDRGVRQDIQLTDEQLLKYAEMRRNEAHAAGGDPFGRTKRWEGLNKAIEDMLTPQQLARLEQIRLQRFGVYELVIAWQFPTEVAAELQLSDEQQQKLAKTGTRSHEAISELSEQWRAIMNDRSLSSKEREAKTAPLEKEMERLRQARSDEVLAVLTPEQREKFEKTQGPKFAGWASRPAPREIDPNIRPDDWCMRLMEYKTVQNDLHLTGDQLAKWHALEEKAEAVLDLMRYVGSYEEQRMRAQLAQTAEGILSPRQIARIHEIELQTLGVDALDYLPVVEALGITEQQKDKLKTFKANYEKTNKVWRPRDEATIAEAVAMLTPQQRTQFDKMRGAKFDVSAFWAEVVQRRKTDAPQAHRAVDR